MRRQTFGIAYTKEPRGLSVFAEGPEEEEKPPLVVVVRKVRVQASRREVWMWSVVCGDRGRGRESSVGGVGWMVAVAVVVVVVVVVERGGEVGIVGDMMYENSWVEGVR